MSDPVVQSTELPLAGVTLKAAPSPCHVCGHDTTTDGSGLYYWLGYQLLSCLCVRCHSAGIIWAAKQARKEQS